MQKSLCQTKYQHVLNIDSGDEEVCTVGAYNGFFFQSFVCAREERGFARREPKVYGGELACLLILRREKLECIYILRMGSESFPSSSSSVITRRQRNSARCMVLRWEREGKGDHGRADVLLQ